MFQLIERMIAKVKSCIGVLVKFGSANHKRKLDVSCDSKHALFDLFALDLSFFAFFLLSILFALLFASDLCDRQFESKVDLVLFDEHFRSEAHIV